MKTTNLLKIKEDATCKADQSSLLHTFNIVRGLVLMNCLMSKDTILVRARRHEFGISV
jgi:hypothetical protein